MTIAKYSLKFLNILTFSKYLENYQISQRYPHGLCLFCQIIGTIQGVIYRLASDTDGSVKTDHGSNNWWEQKNGELTITANTVWSDKHNTLNVEVCK